MIGRAAQHDPPALLPVHLREQGFHQARFANPSFTPEHDDLSLPRRALRPVISEHSQFRFPSHQRTQVGRSHGLQRLAAVSASTRATDMGSATPLRAWAPRSSQTK